MRFLVTGGAGLVGSRIASSFAREHPGAELVAFENLRRRGSETDLGRRAAGGASSAGPHVTHASRGDTCP